MPAKNTTAQTKTTPRKNPNTLPSTRSSALIRATSSILRKIVPKSPMAKTQATQIKTAAIIVRIAGPKLSSGMSPANSGENRIAKTIPITQPTIDKISRTTPRVTPTTVERTTIHSRLTVLITCVRFREAFALSRLHGLISTNPPRDRHWHSS